MNQHDELDNELNNETNDNETNNDKSNNESNNTITPNELLLFKEFMISLPAHEVTEFFKQVSDRNIMNPHNISYSSVKN